MQVAFEVEVLGGRDHLERLLFPLGFLEEGALDLGVEALFELLQLLQRLQVHAVPRKLSVGRNVVFELDLLLVRRLQGRTLVQILWEGQLLRLHIINY